MAARRARHRSGSRRVAVLGGRTPVLAGIAVLAVLGATLLVLALGGDPDGGAAAGGGPATAPAPSSTAGAPAAPAPSPAPDRSAEELLAWAARELPGDARLRPEDDVRDDVLAAGAPERLVTTEEPTGPGDVVLTVTGGQPRPGSRVVARFGGLTVVDPSPGAPPPEQLDRRRALAGAILDNPTTHLSQDAAAVLRSGEVDMRLLTLLAVLTAREGVDVAAFPRDPGAEGPARSAVVTAVGGAPVGAGQPATAPLRTWLDAQLPPFAPDTVEVTDGGVLLAHRYASDPDGLVAEVSP